jgi:ERCC4-type nuclease
MERSKLPPFVITRDTREQQPYMFRFARQDPKRWTAFKLVRRGLAVGDYAAQRSGQHVEATTPVRHVAVIERKSLADLYSTLSGGRDRFFAEMEKMRLYGYACVVVEAPMEGVFDPNERLKRPTRLNPRSVIATLLAISQRFGVFVWTLPHRHGAEQFTFRILERWYLDGTNNGNGTSGIHGSGLQSAVFPESGG